MARGWESKSVEAQIDTARETYHVQASENAPDPLQLELIRKRETIALSRTRVLRELASAQNPRYRNVLQKALDDLNAQLAAIAVD